MVADALVNSFVMSAKNNDVFVHRQNICCFLVENFSVGRCVDYFIVVAFAFQFFDGRFNGLNCHYHSGTFAKRIIINASVFVVGIVAQVVHNNFSKPFIPGSFDDGKVQRTLKYFRQNSDDVNSHDFLIQLCKGKV